MRQSCQDVSRTLRPVNTLSLTLNFLRFFAITLQDRIRLRYRQESPLCAKSLDLAGNKIPNKSPAAGGVSTKHGEKCVYKSLHCELLGFNRIAAEVLGEPR